MGRICPILDHPLVDGVLVNNVALVKFIQKRNMEFLSTELVCRSCKKELIKLYNKTLKKAMALREQVSLREGSLSTIRKSETSTSSGSSSTTDISIVLAEYKRNRDVMTNGRANNVRQNDIETNTSIGQNSSKITPASSVEILAVSSTSIRLSTSNIHSKEEENQITLKSIAPADKSNVTLRKRPIRNFLSPLSVRKASSEYSEKAVHSSQSNGESDDIDRRLSQQPSTSKAAPTTRPRTNSNKRPISDIVDDEDDDECLSLNAFNGTRLPHIQPIPPKRKPQPTNWNRQTLDVMDKYINDITGG